MRNRVHDNTDAPKRLPQKFVALAAMKFVKEIFKVSGRWLLVTFQAKQFRDLVVVKLVHLLGESGDWIFSKFV